MKKKHASADGLFNFSSVATCYEWVSDHVVITDRFGKIIYANPVAELKTGYRLEEMLGKEPGDLWGGKMPKPYYVDMWKKLLVDKQPFVGEVKNTRKDGMEWWAELRITPVLAVDGEVMYLFGIEPDVTSKRLQMQMQRDFNAIVGHQLLAPLTANRWVMEWLLSHKDVPADVLKEARLMTDRNKQVLELILELLVLSRMERVTTADKRVDLAKEIRAIVRETKMTHPGTTFRVRVPKTPCAVMSKPTLVHEALQNVIRNAAEYSDSKTGRVDVTLACGKDRIEISCQDNGIGIPKKDLPKLFTRFFRGSNAKRAKEVGTGLGLYIVRSITDHLHWDVSVSSTVGTGTRVVFSIPRTR